MKISLSQFFTNALYFDWKRVLVLISFLFLIVLWFAASSLKPFYHPDYEPVRVKKFVGLSWGSSKEEVLSEMGSSASDSFVEAPYGFPKGIMGTRITYRGRRILSEPVNISFFFSPRGKLIRGLIKVDGSKTNCRQLVKKFERVLDEKYPQLQKWSRTKNPTNDPFCEALVDGSARRLVRWLNPHSTETVNLSVGWSSDGEGTGPTVVFESELMNRLGEETSWFSWP